MRLYLLAESQNITHGKQSVTVIPEYFNFVCRYTGLLYKDGKSAIQLSAMCTV